MVQDKYLDQLAEAAEKLCYATIESLPPQPNNSVYPYCPSLWDGWGCWNYTEAGSTAYTDCPGFIHGFDPTRKAHRYCTEEGEWWRSPNNNSWANYTTCIDFVAIERGKRVIKMYISGYSISAVFLAIALFIFYYFRQLQCTRVTLHKNLFTSYILSSISFILYYSAAALQPTVLDSNPFWCQMIHVGTQYFVTCNFFWMFCEGLYLHTIIVVAFTTGKKLLIGCFVIGWGMPIIPTLIYTLARGLDETASTYCWVQYTSEMWILFAPIISTLIVNIIFICNIIRVLITKIRAVNSPSSIQHRKAVRAALILIPLLGIQFILFPFEPPEGTMGQHVFQMLSAFTASFQGFFVAGIFCFGNSEVSSVLRRKWGQHRLMRSGSVISKHRDSTFFNHTQATIVIDDNSTGCMKTSRSSSIKKLLPQPFKSRSKSCDSDSGFVVNPPGGGGENFGKKRDESSALFNGLKSNHTERRVGNGGDVEMGVNGVRRYRDVDGREGEGCTGEDAEMSISLCDTNSMGGGNSATSTGHRVTFGDEVTET